MKRIGMLTITALVLIGLLVVPGSFVTAGEPESTGEFLILFDSWDIPAGATAEVEAAGGEVIKAIPQIGVLVVSADAGFEDGAISGASAVGQNTIWELEQPVEVQVLEETSGQDIGDNDLYMFLQWDIKRVGGDADTWDIQKGADVIVAVLDTGVHYPHPDIAPNYLYGKSYVVDHYHPEFGDVPGEDENDYHGHGTHVAGSIAAPITQGRVIGVAPEAGIANYKVMAAGGYGYTSWILEGIVDAADDGCHVINMSLGGYRYMPDEAHRAGFLAYARAIEYAWDQGTLTVASSGNGALDLVRIRPWFHSPSGAPKAISVHSSGAEDELAVYSNYGPVDQSMTAPGGGVTDIPFSLCVSTYSPLGQLEGAMYVWMAGTSMAAPKVSAVAALIYAENPGIDPGAVRAILFSTAERIGPNRIFGHGLVDAYAAVGG